MADTEVSTTAKSDTPDLLFMPTSGMPGIFATNFDYQLARLMGATTYGGAAVGECFATARRIRDGDGTSFGHEWNAVGERVLGLGNESLSRDHPVSARDAFLRAEGYFRTGTRFLSHDDPMREEMWRKSRNTFQRAAALFDPPIEVLSIPYEDGKTLPGYFVRPDSSSRPRPTIMIIGGGDTTGEELFYWGGIGAIRRGWNALLWEGPGQTGAFFLDRDLHYRHDWEVPTGFVIDYALSRGDVDANRLAMMGYSWGGYYTPRAAAFDKRIKAIVANPIPVHARPFYMALLGLDPDHDYADEAEVQAAMNTSAPLRSHVAEDLVRRCGFEGRPIIEWFEFLRDFELWGLEERMTCPLLHIMGEGEGDKFLIPARKFYESLTCPKAERLVHGFEGGEAHCTVNNPGLRDQITFDWLEEVLPVG